MSLGDRLASVSTLSSCSSKRSFGSVKEKNREEVKTLSEGDTVKFARSMYFHYAVYIGRDLVVNLVSDFKDSKKVCTCEDEDRNVQDGTKTKCKKCKKPYRINSEITIQNIHDVAGSSLLKRANDFDRNKSFRARNPAEIKKRAEDMWGPANYHWREMNCEHFANWCRYDHPFSSQIGKDWDDVEAYARGLKKTNDVDTDSAQTGMPLMPMGED